MLISKAKGKGCKLFLSSTMLFRKEIQYIKDRINNYNEATNYMYHVGQYLPDWHPWESYKHFFVNEKRSNGCRELFAIELPWIIKTFGQVESIIVHKSKMTNLDIVYCDNYMVTIVHQTGHKGTIMLDIVSRKATRRLEIIGEEIYLMWEGTPQSLKEYDFKEKIDQPIETYSYIDKNHNYSENIIENAYVDEIREFLEILQGKEKISYTFEEDKIILGIIDQIEEQ
jgi:predicted dehydrogenase